MSVRSTNPALTYTLDDFIAVGFTDEMTYFNFSIIEVVNNIQLLDHNLVEDYMEELESLCAVVELSEINLAKYRYCPDLLAYDLYKSTQLDFIILFVNDMIDPKEFNKKKIKLPYASKLKAFLSSVYNAESGYLAQNRSDNGLNIY